MRLLLSQGIIAPMGTELRRSRNGDGFRKASPILCERARDIGARMHKCS